MKNDHLYRERIAYAMKGKWKADIYNIHTCIYYYIYEAWLDISIRKNAHNVLGSKLMK